MKKNKYNNESYLNNKIRFYKRNIFFVIILFLISFAICGIVADNDINLKIKFSIFFLLLIFIIICLTVCLMIYLSKKYKLLKEILNSNDFLELIDSQKPTKLPLDEINYSISIFDLLSQNCYEVISEKYNLFYKLLKFRFSKKMDCIIYYFYEKNGTVFDKKEYKYNEEIYLLSENNPHTQIIIDFTNKTFLLLNELINEYLVDGTNSKDYQKEIENCFISFEEFYNKEEEFYIKYLSTQNYSLIDENLISKSRRLQEALNIINGI